MGYSYRQDGLPATVTYPFTYQLQSGQPVNTFSSYTPTPLPVLTYSYDAFGRPISMKDSQSTPVTWAQGAVYNEAGQLKTLSYTAAGTAASAVLTETRNYNTLHQLTEISVPGAMDIQYNYSATQNNGRITSQVDALSGESVTYQYDSLQRLSRATSTTGATTNYDYVYSFDGFGNRLTQGMTALLPDPATNRLTGSGYSYDAAGNMTSMPTLSGTQSFTYDADNRPTGTTYSSGGQRLADWTTNATQPPSRMYLYGAQGELIAKLIIHVTGNGGSEPYQAIHSIYEGNQYFAGKFIGKWTFANDGVSLQYGAVVRDRLGNLRYDADPRQSSYARRYAPYGEELSAPPFNNYDREKFATYTRDGSTGLDYANARAYASMQGRFTTSDPYQSSGGAGDPQSWNQYAYTRGDPVNRLDPSGLQDQERGSCNPGDPNCTGLFTCPDGTVVLIGGICPNGTPVQSTNKRNPGQSANTPGSTNSAKGIRGIEKAVLALTNNDKCAKALGFKNATDAINRLQTMVIHEADLGSIVQITTDGIVHPLFLWGQAGIGSNEFTLNSNRLIASDLTAVDVNGKKYNFLAGAENDHNLISGILNTSIWWAIIDLHELGHATGALPSDWKDQAASDANTQKVIDNCFSFLHP